MWEASALLVYPGVALISTKEHGGRETIQRIEDPTLNPTPTFVNPRWIEEPQR